MTWEGGAGGGLLFLFQSPVVHTYSRGSCRDKQKRGLAASTERNNQGCLLLRQPDGPQLVQTKPISTLKSPRKCSQHQETGTRDLGSRPQEKPHRRAGPVRCSPQKSQPVSRAEKCFRDASGASDVIYDHKRGLSKRKRLTEPCPLPRAHSSGERSWTASLPTNNPICAFQNTLN